MSRGPFKFLDSYDKEDKDRFFGRERETAQLFNAVHASNLVVVYGASGTGKTSLINCGLGNQFLPSDWLPLFVRRGVDLNASLDRALEQAMKRDRPIPDAPVGERVRALYLDHYVPIYLIFDQFEEIFTLGSRAEQEQFYQTVRELLESKARCKILIVLREEYIAFLSDFEKVVPALLDTRLRIERMNDPTLARVIMGTAQSAGVEIEDPRETVFGILDNIRDRRTGVDLANLQVYLDRLWRADQERKGGDDRATRFDLKLIEQVGPLHNVISDFLDEQLAQIEQRLVGQGLSNASGVPLEVLFTLVTEEGTKRNLDTGAILEALPPDRGITESHLNFCLDEFERIRLVRPLVAG